MRNKKIKYITAVLAAGLMLTNCSDSFLENKVQLGVFDEKTFENQTQVGWYINNMLYSYWYGYNSPGKVLVGTFEDRTSWTEESGGITDNLNPTKEINTADKGSTYYGAKLSTSVSNYPYDRIRSCNFIINGIDELGTNITDAFKATAKGQCYFMRAMQYFDLMRVYGGVPITLKVEYPDANDESMKYKRATPTEMVEQIYADLDSAAELLPTKWDADNFGRFTSVAALAMKSRVALTFASPLFNKDWENEGNERWATALDYSLKAESAATAAGYGLYGSNAKDWHDMFLVDNSFCKEAIMVKMLSPDLASAENSQWENAVRLTSQTGAGGMSAPWEMLEAFPMADGSRPTAEFLKDSLSFMMNRDPRFYRTFAFSGCKWGYGDKRSDVVWSYRWGYKNTGGNTSYDNADANDMSSPAYVRKMSNDAALTPFTLSGTDIMDYRFAELVLNIAECYAAQGKTDQCLQHLGQVRSRVGIPSANNYGIGTLKDKYAAIEACLYERRIELAYEGKRWYDLQRWMLYSDDTMDGKLANNTCAKLGLKPLNGTHRTGKYLLYKNTLDTDADPLLEARKGFAIDPDDPTSGKFETDLEALKKFYADNFRLADLDIPMDNDGSGKAVDILWRPQYYIFGLTRTVLSNNPWLTQTIGWTDASASAGTFNFQE